ncbi:hypothetical protein BP6252_07093 [Coleophoma cylindrospora]|uniref:Uncharacterized protein n=1 Tax=Coleophoma cylindrospora TaxID=1849047 RepID=A0A3D8RGV0_9HELO|nr:hypothetical protein BP6252_07093 [Coleophoma cylindrospora]
MPDPISINFPLAHSNFPLPVLLACLQLYQEIRPLYFSTNIFCISVHRHNEDWDYFWEQAWEDNRRQIREVHIKFVRWGSKDFLPAVLLPVLGDMVLKGSLRRIEVTFAANFLLHDGGGSGLRRKPLKDRQAYMNSTKRESLRASRPVQVLKELLEDPDLEHVRMLASWDVNGDKDDGTEAQHSEYQDVTWLLDR